MKKLIVYLSLGLYLLLFLFQNDKALTQDLGRHIKLGEIITHCLCVPQVNLFSFTEPNHAFINHHWFSEVVFYDFYRLLGLNSILFLKILLIITAFLLTTVLALKRAKPFWVFFWGVFYVNLFSERFDSRPEIFSFLFLSLFLFLLFRYQQKGFGKYLLLLPLLEIFWVNMHIYFIIGPLLFSFLLISEFFKTKKIPDKKLIGIFILTLLSTLINPNFINGALNPFTIFQEYGYSIVENQNVFFLNSMLFNPKILLFEIIAACFFVGLILSIKKLSVFEILVSLFSLIAAFYQTRNFPVFILLTFSTCTYNYSFLYEKVKSKLNKNFSFSLATFGLFFSIIFIILSAKEVLFSPYLGISYVKGAEKGVNFIEENNIQGKIFNNFDIGSYLIFRLYPKEKVFVDGRPESYSASFFQEYIKIQGDQKLFDIAVKKYKINTVFFSHRDITPWTQQFLNDIVKNKDWAMVYVDDWIVILVKNNEQNREIIHRYSK